MRDEKNLNRNWPACLKLNPFFAATREKVGAKANQLRRSMKHTGEDLCSGINHRPACCRRLRLSMKTWTYRRQSPGSAVDLVCAESPRRRAGYSFKSAFKTRFLFPKGVKKKKKKRPRDFKHLKLGIYENLHPDVSLALGSENPRTRERQPPPPTPSPNPESPLGPQVSVGRAQSEEQNESWRIQSWL